MRIGQLARKYDIPVQKITTYLEEQTGEKLHPNTQLYDTLETKVFNHFDLHFGDPVALESTEKELTSPEHKKIAENPISESKATFDETPEKEIATVEGEIATVEGEIELPDIPVKAELPKVEEDSGSVAEKVELVEDEIIWTDQLLKILESEETPVDLEKIKLIKAPKKELSGLKVLGKIELPEPKKKSKPEEKQKPHTRRKLQPELSKEEKEQQRLKEKRKKEAHEARQIKRHKEQEIQRLKEFKEAHYKKKLQKAEVKEQKQKVKSPPAPTLQIKDTKTVHKTWLGKWWKWMNT